MLLAQNRQCAAGAGTVLCLTAVALFVVAGGCQRPRRIPRIEPVLNNWQEPYRGFAGMRLHVFHTGTIELPAAAVFGGGSWLERRRLDTLAFVVEHPSAGLVLFDTGLSPRVRSDPKGYLGSLLAATGAVTSSRGQDLPAQMRAAGLDPAGVRYVVLSDLHFDHTGTVEAFPGATVVVARREKQQAASAPWWRDLFFDKDYDAVSRWLEIDYEEGEAYATFFTHHDLLGDASIVLIDLRGHTPGSQGMLVRLEGGPVLLVGDAAPVEESWRYAEPPVLAYDAQLCWEQIWRIKKFVQLVPSAIVIAGHDTGILAREHREAIIDHPFSSPKE